VPRKGTLFVLVQEVVETASRSRGQYQQTVPHGGHPQSAGLNIGGAIRISGGMTVFFVAHISLEESQPWVRIVRLVRLCFGTAEKVEP
jgi:hypothetical protein